MATPTVDVSDFDSFLKSQSKSDTPDVSDFDDFLKKQRAPVDAEVNKAIATVPKPRLDYMQTEQTPLSPIAQPPTPVSPEAKAYQADLEKSGSKFGVPEAAGLVSGALTGSSGGGASDQKDYGAETTSGLHHVATPGKRALGALELADVATQAISPVVGPAALENPIQTAVGMATGAATSKGAGYAADKLGASPETKELVETLGFWAPTVAGALASRMGLQFGMASGPEETQFAAKIGNENPSRLIVKIPKAPAEPTPEPGLEPPTIEGQIASQPPEVSKAASAMVQVQQQESAAAAQAAGIPPAPPPAPPAPPPMPEVSAEMVGQIGSAISKLPKEMQAQAILETHQTLANVLLHQGKFVDPDGQVQIVENEKQAAKLAQKLINEEVSRQDDAAEEAAKPENHVVDDALIQQLQSEHESAEPPATTEQAQPEGNLRPTDNGRSGVSDNAEVGEAPVSGSQPAALQKGQSVSLKSDLIRGDKSYKAGTKGEITWVAPGDRQPMVRLKLEDGSKITLGPSQIATGQAKESEKQSTPVLSRHQELVARYAPHNPFSEKAATAREKYERLTQPTAREKAMEASFPLGGGYGRPGAEKRIDSSVNRAVEAEQHRKDAVYYEAQAAAHDAGEINAQGRSVSPESAARSEKREESQSKRDERIASAKAARAGKELWEIPADVYADSTGNLGGGARGLVKYDHEQAVEKAIAEGKTVPPEVLKDYPELRPAEPPKPSIAPESRENLGMPPKAGEVGNMKVSAIHLDPKRFQYKLSTDAEGVSTLLKETKVFNPDLAGIVSVWRDPNNGKTYVINGHHRLELAKRTETKKISVRHIVAPNATAARAIGAQQNIAEGRGTAIDAAKFMRDSGLSAEDLKGKGISLGEKTATDGVALSRLDPSLFNKVVSGDLRQGRGVAIGEATDDPAEQKAILSLVEKKEARGAKVTDGVLRELVRLVKSSAQKEETTADLFGNQQITRSLALEKAEISDYIKSQLGKDKRLFGFVAKESRASELSRAGNKIDVEKSKEISTGAAQAEEVYNKLSSYAGPIQGILDEAAQRLADGDNAATVKSEAYQRIRAEVSKTLSGGQGSGAQRSQGASEDSEAAEGETGKPKGDVDLFRADTPAFYSKAEQIALQKVPNSASGDSILATLKNSGVKEDEMKWLGLDDFLKGKSKVSKQELLEHVRENSLQIKEVSRSDRSGESALTSAYNRFYDLASQQFGIQANAIADDIQDSSRSSGEILHEEWEYQSKQGQPPAELLEAGRELLNAATSRREAARRGGAGPKYESYTLPGDKKNYTELLLTLPEQPKAGRFVVEKNNELFRIKDTKTGEYVLHSGSARREFGTGDEYAATDHANSLNRQHGADATRVNENTFRSSHFEEPNILAHVRLDDRTDADGKKVLFIEEVQSDWHQKGKKEGYKGGDEQAFQSLKNQTESKYGKSLIELREDVAHAEDSAETAQKMADLRAIDRAYEAAQNEKHGNKVPDAPFKKDWHELAVKRMLRHAAEGGYDRMAWVTGAQTADRYDLAKHVDKIYWQPNEGILQAYVPNYGWKHLGSDLTESKLADYIGKEAAAKIVKPEAKDVEASTNSETTVHSLSGPDLKVGGEWAKNLYDRAIPNFLSKYGKKWGVKVGDLKIGTPSRDVAHKRYAVLNPNGDVAGQYATIGEARMVSRARFENGSGNWPGGLPWKVEDSFPESDSTVHSIDITPEMKKSVLEEGQPLFKDDYSLITGISPAAQAQIAEGMRFSIKSAQGKIPAYLEMNRNTARVLGTAMNHPLLGVTISDPDEVSQKLRDMADNAHTQGQYNKLRELADHIDNLHAMQPHSGVAVLPANTSPNDAMTQWEELFHSAVQFRAGKGEVLEGVPYKELIDDPGFTAQASRIKAEVGKQNPHPVVIVAEGMFDIVSGRAQELSPEQAEKSATAYYQALAKKAPQELEAAQELYDQIDQKMAGWGIIQPGEQYDPKGTGPARRAIARVRAEHSRAATGQHGSGLSKESAQGSTAPSGKTGAKGSDLPAGAGKADLGPPAAGGQPSGPSLKSTHLIGLNDEELEAWSKNKGFHVEAAGEQPGLFGDSDRIFRVFRTTKGGEESGLVYENQLDRAGIPSEPGVFEAQHQASIDEAQRARDEEAGRQGSLFRRVAKDESGELRPGEIGKAAGKASGAIGEFLRETQRNIANSRELQSGLYDLESQYSADVLRAVQTMRKVTAELGGKKEARADFEAIYHHLENPAEPLTSAQDKVLDNTILPLMDESDRIYQKLTQGGIPAENYVHRVTRGKGGFLDRIMHGGKGSGRGNVLSKSAPQTKQRTMMALENDKGERKVVSLKGGQVTAWKNGNPENLGPIMHTAEGKAFEDKDGNTWNLTQATTREIEQATDLRYYHNALASALTSYLQLRKAERGFDFINDLKADPQFKEIAAEAGKGNPPDGWRATDLPQLRGYYFEPHVAEVLDWYSQRLKGGAPGVLEQIGKFLRTSIFFNPLMHTPNIAVHWAVEKGATGLLPHQWRRLYRTSVKAINAVKNQNQDFLDALEAGAPLQSQREDTAQLNKLFFEQLSDALDKEEPWAVKLAKAIGTSPAALVKAIYKFSGKVTWVSNDIAFLQAAYEKVEAGMPLKEALQQTGKHIPDYRIPTRVFNSFNLAKIMSNPAVTMFSAYHYGALRSYGEMAKSALGIAEPPTGRSKAGEVAHGWELLAWLGLLTFVAYPMIDELLKHVTGNPNARLRRAGAATFPFNIQQMTRKEKTPAEVLEGVMTPAVGTKAAVELGFNHSLDTGRQIYDPMAPAHVMAQQIGHHLAEAVSPVGQAVRLSESQGAGKRFLYGLGGVTFPQQGAEKVAQKIASAKYPVEAETEQGRKSYYVRKAALDALRKGDSAPLGKGIEDGTITKEQAHEIRHRAKLTPLQDRVHNFSYSELMEVYNAPGATPEQKKELDPIVRTKRRNLIARHKGAELENP